MLIKTIFGSYIVLLVAGFVVSQLMPTWLAHDEDALKAWDETVSLVSMLCLSYICIHVGYEVEIEKDKPLLQTYGKDFVVAMAAAMTPWILVTLYFVYMLEEPMDLIPSLIAAHFAGPTSAGILFSMLEAVGMKRTWLYEKARVLAIFDDLETVVLIVPLKVMVLGWKIEFITDLIFTLILVCASYKWLHTVRIPNSWRWTLFYACLITLFTEVLHLSTAYNQDWTLFRTVPVLVPAFAVGALARTGHTEKKPSENHHQTSDSSAPVPRRRLSRTKSILLERQWLVQETSINYGISAVFMGLVGLGMPPIFDLVGTTSTDAGCDDYGDDHRRLAAGCDDHGDDHGDDHRRLAAEFFDRLLGVAAAPSTHTSTFKEIAVHVFVVSVLMIVGKALPAFCYRDDDETSLSMRVALWLTMCPRGEVAIGCLFISLNYGITKQALIVSVACLILNMLISPIFILVVKSLATEEMRKVELPRRQSRTNLIEMYNSGDAQGPRGMSEQPGNEYPPMYNVGEEREPRGMSLQPGSEYPSLSLAAISATLDDVNAPSVGFKFEGDDLPAEREGHLPPDPKRPSRHRAGGAFPPLDAPPSKPRTLTKPGMHLRTESAGATVAQPRAVHAIRMKTRTMSEDLDLARDSHEGFTVSREDMAGSSGWVL